MEYHQFPFDKDNDLESLPVEMRTAHFDKNPPSHLYSQA